MKYYYGSSYKEAVSNDPVEINDVKTLKSYQDVYSVVLSEDEVYPETFGDYVVLIKHPTNEMLDEYENYDHYSEAKERFESLKEALLKPDQNFELYAQYAKAHEIVFYNQETDEEYDSINI